MIWAFVDYENVGSLESLDLEKYQRLIVFCGPRHRKLNLGEIPTSSFCHLELIRMASTGNNNLDFHLAFYLGLHHLKAGKEVEFEVISNDKGFDGVIAHLTEMGRGCLRVSSVKKKVTKKVVAKKTVAKKAATKKVAKKAVKKTAKKAVKKVTKKTAKKVAAKKTSKKLAKTTVKKAAKKSGKKILLDEVVLKKLKEIVMMLDACPDENLPNKKEKLINWVANKLNDDFVTSCQIVEHLQEAEIIVESEGGLIYYFSEQPIPTQTDGVTLGSSGTAPKDYPHSSLEIAQAIKFLDLKDRPRDSSALEQWVMDKLGVTVFVARGIYNKLIREGCIQISEGWIDYDFKKAL